MNGKLKDTKGSWQDEDDAPELDATFFEHASYHVGNETVSKEVYAEEVRKRGRPKSDSAKVAVKLRLDPDLLAAIKATGPGWQTRINQFLRKQFVS